MKAFKEWKDSNCVKNCNLCHIGVCGDCGGIGTKEDTWKAALEWVKRNSQIAKSLYMIDVNVIDNELRGMIWIG